MKTRTCCKVIGSALSSLPGGCTVTFNVLIPFRSARVSNSVHPRPLLCSLKFGYFSGGNDLGFTSGWSFNWKLALAGPLSSFH